MLFLAGLCTLSYDTLKLFMKHQEEDWNMDHVPKCKNKRSGKSNVLRSQ